VAHNAGFDIAFLDAELNRAAKPAIAAERVVDTLALVQRSTLADTTRSTTCAHAMTLIARTAANTARCSMPSCARNAFRPRADFRRRAGIRQILPEGMAGRRMNQVVAAIIRKRGLN